MKSRVLELEELIKEHDYHYFVLGESLVTDAEYDSLVKEYTELGGVLNKVPGEVSTILEKVSHHNKVLSLDKINTEQQLRAEISRLKPVVVTLKYDGISFVHYNNGTDPEVIATRGSGVEGENITHTANKTLFGTKPIEFPVRGEMFIEFNDFEDINNRRQASGEEPYKNMRNAVSGNLRQKDASSAFRVSYVAYELMGCDWCLEDQLEYLKEHDYRVPEEEHIWIINTTEEINSLVALATNFQEFRGSLAMEVDGLVVKSNIANSLEVHGGTTGHHPKDAIAFKFPSQSVWTTLKNIRWQVGRTGKITPVCILSPVNLLNSTVGKATLHNASMIDRLNLTQGCEVLITKCNDVIPGVIQSRGTTGVAFEEPTMCPVCKTSLKRQDSKENEGVYQLYCHNLECGAKTVLRTVHLAQKTALNITGLAEETVQKMYDDMLIEQPYHIFGLTCDELISLEGFARASGQKLHKAIQGARETSLDRFLYAGGIPLVGKSTCELIATELESWDRVLEDVLKGCPRISNIPGIGDKMVESILDYYSVWVSMSDFVTPKDMIKAVKVENALTFVITGTLPKKRSYYETLIKQSGHNVSGSISKKTHYLLAGDKAGSKMEKAREVGTQVITTEEELMSILNK